MKEEKQSRAKKILTDMDMLTAQVPQMDPTPDPRAPMREKLGSVLKKVEEARADLLECQKALEEGNDPTLESCKKKLQAAMDEVDKEYK